MTLLNDSVYVAAVIVVAMLISYLTYLVVRAGTSSRRGEQRTSQEEEADDGRVPRIITVGDGDNPADASFESSSQVLTGPFVSFVEMVSNSIVQRFCTFLGFTELGDALQQQQSGSKVNRVINIIQVLCVVVMWFIVSKIIAYFF